MFDKLVSLFSDCFLEIKMAKKSRLASVSRLINREKQVSVVNFMIRFILIKCHIN